MNPGLAPFSFLLADILSSTVQLGGQTRDDGRFTVSGMSSKIRTIDRRPATRRIPAMERTLDRLANRPPGKRPFPSLSGADKPRLRAPLGDVPYVGPACVLAETADDRVAGGTVLCVEDVGSISSS
jgi:hypothetical protein